MAEFFADRRRMSASAAYEFDKEIDRASRVSPPTGR
jgi:hypothetical protein